MDWILCSDDCWLVQTWQMLCGLKTILTDMNILNSYRHIRPKKVKYPIPEKPDDSGKKSGMDWVLPKIIGSGRVSGTRQALNTTILDMHKSLSAFCHCNQCHSGHFQMLHMWFLEILVVSSSCVTCVIGPWEQPSPFEDFCPASFSKPTLEHHMISYFAK